MADETPEEFHARLLRFLIESGYDVDWAIEVLERHTQKKKKDKEDSEKKHQKGGNADRGLRVGFGGVGLVLSLPMVLDLWPWSWTCAYVIPQLISELKHMLSPFVFQLSQLFNSASCNSATEPWKISVPQSQMAWSILSEVAMLSSDSVGQAFPQWMTSLVMDQTLRVSSATLAMMENLMLLVLGARLRWNSAGSHFRMAACTARTWVWTWVHAFVLCVSEHGCMAFIN